MYFLPCAPCVEVQYIYSIYSAVGDVLTVSPAHKLWYKILFMACETTHRARRLRSGTYIA